MVRRFWIGKECEGKFKGVNTLFIVGNESISNIFNALCYDVTINHLYFGAGHQSKVTKYSSMRYFAKKGFIITYEIILNDLKLIPKDILNNKNIHLMITIKSSDFDKVKITDSFKIEGKENVYVCVKESMFKNDFKEYKKDKEVKI